MNRSSEEVFFSLWEVSSRSFKDNVNNILNGVIYYVVQGATTMLAEAKF